MKEFLMTSTIPYWLLFIACIASIGYGFLVMKKSSDNDGKITEKQMLTVSGLVLCVALAVIGIYSCAGGNALWWITNKELGFWGKFIRLIPLLIFLILQAAVPFAYNFFMECYFGVKNLTVKTQFISLAVIIPAAIIIVYVIGGFFMKQAMQTIVFYIITGVGIGGAALFSVYKNSSEVGFKQGLIYTITSFVLCAATLNCLLYFIVALIHLILEILPVIATIIGIAIIFGKSYGNAVQRKDNDGNYIASDGSKHSSAGARDYRDAQINSNRQNN